MNGIKVGERESCQATLYVCWEATGRYDIRRHAYAYTQPTNQIRRVEKRGEACGKKIFP